MAVLAVRMDMTFGMTGASVVVVVRLWLGHRHGSLHEPEVAVRSAMRMAVQALAVTVNVQVGGGGGHRLRAGSCTRQRAR